MMIRPWAEFESSLPDDVIETEDGRDILQQGGKSVAEAMHEILQRFGCQMDPVEYAGDHGWDFTFTYQKRALWCQVILIEKYLAVVRETSMFGKMFGPKPAYIELMRRLAEAMAADPRFQDVRWYAEREVHSDAPGALSPVPSAA